MDDLRVPKRQVPAELLLPGGGTRRIALFLAEAAHDHAGPERPSDLLNRGAGFVPAFDEAAGGITFVGVAGIAALRVDRALEEDLAEAEILPTEHEIEVQLESGASLRGLLSYARPLEHSRLADFLNEPAPFFALLQEDGIALVNKRHVARIVPAPP
jgi:hypothetical protein